MATQKKIISAAESFVKATPSLARITKFNTKIEIKDRILTGEDDQDMIVELLTDRQSIDFGEKFYPHTRAV
jgi:hypothetical protein